MRKDGKRTDEMKAEMGWGCNITIRQYSRVAQFPDSVQ